MNLHGSATKIKQAVLHKKKQEINSMNVNKRHIFIIKAKYEKKIKLLMDSIK